MTPAGGAALERRATATSSQQTGESSATLREFQPAHGAGGGREPIRFDSHPLQHADVQVGQRIVVLRVESEILPVAETAAGQDDGHVGADVGVGVAEVGTVQHHGAIEQRVVAFAARI